MPLDSLKMIMRRISNFEDMHDPAINICRVNGKRKPDIDVLVQEVCVVKREASHRSYRPEIYMYV